MSAIINVLNLNVLQIVRHFILQLRCWEVQEERSKFMHVDRLSVTG